MKPFRSSGQSFNEIPLSDPKKSSFDLSYTNKGSGKIGRLIPVSQKECLPGDRISCDVHSLLRFEPLAVPLLSDMNLRHHQYFVPFRQVWSSFESFITGGKDGYSDSHVVPSVFVKDVLLRVQYSFVSMMLKLIENDAFAFNNYLRFSVGTDYVSAVSLVIDIDSSDHFEVSDVSGVKRDVLAFCQGWINIFNSYKWQQLLDLSGLFQEFYGSDVPLHAFDIWMYDVRHIVSKWKAKIPLSDITSSSSTREIAQACEDFMHDLYDFIYSPFVGPSSNWDYLGYPVDFWLKNGYEGILYPHYTTFPDDSVKSLWWFWQNSTARASWGVYQSKLSDNNCTFDLMPNNAGLDSVAFSVLPLRAMYRIWFYNYRDQNLEVDVLDPDSSSFKSDVGLDNILTLLMPRCCAWSKDMFTTATLQAYSTNLVVPIRDETETQLEESALEVPIVDLPDGTSQNVTIKIPTHFVQKDNSPLASISGLTLSNLRKVQALARWLDKNLFVGFQYADQLFSHYNVKYSDARLQIPEYLAGNSEIVRMEVITNNTSTTEQVAGDQVARAQGLTRSSVDGYFIEEHGLYFAIMSVLPDQSYPFGVDRSLLMTNKFDIAFPEFAQLGSDIVNTCEVYFTGYKDFQRSAYTGLKAFGYQGRYYHYKSSRNEQHGELNTSRREWTFARFFDKAPVLNSDFIHCTPNLEMFVSPYSDQFVYDVLINLRAQRSLPVYDQVL